MTKVIVVLCAGSVFVAAPAMAEAEDVAPSTAAPLAAPPPASPAFAATPAYGPPPPASTPFAATPAYGPPPPLLGDRKFRSPGLAVALSLQPLPIDFGNLYAENLGWGIAYTAIEVSLLAPMMWMTGAHMDHGSGADRTWSGMETGTMVGFASGYVVVKLISGLHAGYAAQKFNQTYEPRMTALVVPAQGGALFVWSGSL